MLNFRSCENVGHQFLQLVLKRYLTGQVLPTSKKWRLRRERRKRQRKSVEMKSDWLFDNPTSKYRL